jgi:hypothetical protein
MELRFVDGQPVPLTAEELAQRQADALAAPPAPLKVTMAQARAVMRATMVDSETSLLDAADAALRAGLAATGELSKSHPDRIAAETRWQFWEYANEMTRDGLLVAEMGPQLGLDDAQLDALFAAASQLEA